MFSKGVDSITLEDVRRVTDDVTVAARYLGISEIPCLILSPLRQDSKPSLSIFMLHGTDCILYHDFGTGEKGTIYQLLSEIWNIPLHKVYRTVLSDIPGKICISRKGSTGNTVHHRSTSQIKVRIRPWRPYDFEYWGSYGIPSKWLEWGGIYPISHIFIERPDNTSVIPAEKYAYVYVERKDNQLSLKIYQPFSEKFKWMSKHDSSVWDLWTRLPDHGDSLIIASSRKDALCIWANTGIPSVSLQGEGYIPKENVVQQLKERFNKVFVLYDNDFQDDKNYGRAFGSQIAEKFGVIQIEIPTEYHSKDPSDLYRNWGKDIMKTVILQLLQNN